MRFLILKHALWKCFANTLRSTTESLVVPANLIAVGTYLTWHAGMDAGLGLCNATQLCDAVHQHMQGSCCLRRLRAWTPRHRCFSADRSTTPSSALLVGARHPCRSHVHNALDPALLLLLLKFALHAACPLIHACLC